MKDTMTNPTLIKEQQDIVDYISSTDEHVFLTGRAGTGKSTVLREFARKTRKQVLVCAPTGIAALNASGATIHNLLGLGTSMPPDQGVDMFKVRAKRAYIAKELETLIIDEISMVSSDLLDAIDRQLRGIRMNREPFGGVQIVMIGDVYQLPPVVTKEGKKYYTNAGYRSEWFFDAEVWQDAEFKTFSLEKVHRQADNTFIDLLNTVRDGTTTQQELNLLNTLGARPGKTKDAVMLGTRRDMVENRNNQNLVKLKGSRVEYKARVNTGFGRIEPAERLIRLKPGAKVMMLSNDREDRWVNGTQGRVLDCTTDFIRVELENGIDHIIDRFAWVNAGTPPEDYQTAPKFHQFPVKLAWALTIHKAQGLSLPEIEVEVGSGAFSAGQTYVALSRVTSPQGLFISTPLQLSDIKVDPNVRRFFADLEIKRVG